jgi:hypothetical protein
MSAPIMIGFMTKRPASLGDHRFLGDARDCNAGT